MHISVPGNGRKYRGIGMYRFDRSLIVAVAIQCYRYRWYIRHIGFLKKYEEFKDEENYKFDAFISYNSRDREWVLRKLLTELEKRDIFKLCIDERDFEVGAFISDNIIESITRSRKTILIITEAFLDSDWCSFEMNVSSHRLFTTGISSVYFWSPFPSVKWVQLWKVGVPGFWKDIEITFEGYILVNANIISIQILVYYICLFYQKGLC